MRRNTTKKASKHVRAFQIQFQTSAMLTFTAESLIDKLKIYFLFGSFTLGINQSHWHIVEFLHQISYAWILSMEALMRIRLAPFWISHFIFARLMNKENLEIVYFTILHFFIAWNSLYLDIIEYQQNENEWKLKLLESIIKHNVFFPWNNYIIRANRL